MWYTEVLASHHRFWDLSATFIAHKRSAEEMENLLRRLARCDCPMKEPYNRDLRPTGDERQVREDLNDTAGGVLVEDTAYVARARFPRPLIATISHALKGAKTKNVAKENDLFIFSLLAVMGRTCRTLIMPRIVASALPALMVLSGRALFQVRTSPEPEPSSSEPNLCQTEPVLKFGIREILDKTEPNRTSATLPLGVVPTGRLTHTACSPATCATLYGEVGPVLWLRLPQTWLTDEMVSRYSVPRQPSRAMAIRNRKSQGPA
ncbi:hypothetical protein B0H19DRAFT_1083125 [Mycena capillaripes]|nr:hypothetical protein B0H19DRAFT_1083125 [Mycena capillaripes]